ncbi:MAG: phosphoesterase PA-phosphatase, partial [Bariatricus sp.]
MKNVKKQKNLKPLLLPGILFLAFILFTLIVSTVDVKPIGPQNSCVGLASLNQAAANLFGVHLIWYTITDWLGVIAILFAFGFAVLGLCQLIHRKSLFKVDSGILLLGALYILTIALYAFFEIVIINYRPIILNQNLEASYPSSHTMIVTTIMITASFQFHRLLPNHKLLLR